jgi:tetratricopeptide (TPR) repeat protein
MKWLFSLLVCVLIFSPSLRAEGPDEQYVRIYQLVQEADRLNDSGQGRAAAAKYIEAQEALTRFRGIYPGWNERVINYRLDYVATKLAPLSAALAAPRVPVPTNATAGATQTTNVTNAASMSPATVATPMPADFANQIKSLQAEVERLQADNRLLGAKLKEALSVQPAALDPRELAKAEERMRALQKENELYKIQLAQRTSASAPSAAATVPPEISARLKEHDEVIAALRTENDVLKKQTSEWRQKYDEAITTAKAAQPASAPPTAEPDMTVHKLAADNKALQKQVELWKEVARKSQPAQAAAPAPVTSMAPSETRSALEALRARLQVLEAKPVPYTAEELALFEKPGAVLAANVASPGPSFGPGRVLPAEGPMHKVTRGVPVGATELVRAAERAFGTRNYAEAERKYLEIVRQDESNVTMVGNLASAQLEQRHLAEAEKNVKRALELDPNDYFALYLLGRIRFEQEKLDDAFEALSRSARTNPNYADAQNYLGIVLSEKGQRVPAEAALRRAIQLQPDNAVAHNNLAVVYATQKPPALALARWHYQKALAAGHSTNVVLEKLLGQQ